MQSAKCHYFCFVSFIYCTVSDHILSRFFSKHIYFSQFYLPNSELFLDFDFFTYKPPVSGFLSEAQYCFI